MFINVMLQILLILSKKAVTCDSWLVIRKVKNYNLPSH